MTFAQQLSDLMTDDPDYAAAVLDRKNKVKTGNILLIQLIEERRI